MSLSPRFHELIENLELPDALWHLERANAGTENNANEEEIAHGYRQILDIIENVGGNVTERLQQSKVDLREIDSKQLVHERSGVVRELWNRPLSAPEADGLRRSESEIREKLVLHKMSERVFKRATQILDGKNTLSVSDIYTSIHRRTDGLNNEAIRRMTVGEDKITNETTEDPSVGQHKTQTRRRQKKRPLAAVAA